jgi:hypothetical protein
MILPTPAPWLRLTGHQHLDTFYAGVPPQSLIRRGNAILRAKPHAQRRTTPLRRSSSDCRQHLQ